jgi:hypothetical protein
MGYSIDLAEVIHFIYYVLNAYPKNYQGTDWPHMIRVQIIVTCWLLYLLGTLASCVTPQVGQPPPQVIQINTYYKSGNGVDLLNQNNPIAYKQKDLKVVSKMEVNGVTKEVIYEDKGIDVFWDNVAQLHYFGLLVPTSYGKKPIETYVNLSATLIDTVTYTFQNQQRPYIPDKIYYNKKLVWDAATVPSNGTWPPITIIK